MSDLMFEQSLVARRFADRVSDLAAKMGVTSGDMCLALEGLVVSTIIASESPAAIDEAVVVAQRNLKTFAAAIRAAQLDETPPEGRA
ncbi:MAG: hypothetical protein ACK4NA_12720 [Alphaproteobacteria bacterium]